MQPEVGKRHTTVYGNREPGIGHADGPSKETADLKVGGYSRSADGESFQIDLQPHLGRWGRAPRSSVGCALLVAAIRVSVTVCP